MIRWLTLVSRTEQKWHHQQQLPSARQPPRPDASWWTTEFTMNISTKRKESVLSLWIWWCVHGIHCYSDDKYYTRMDQFIMVWLCCMFPRVTGFVKIFWLLAVVKLLCYGQSAPVCTGWTVISVLPAGIYRVSQGESLLLCSKVQVTTSSINERELILKSVHFVTLMIDETRF